MLIALLADACDPSTPGCHPEAQGAAATFIGFLLLVLAFVAVVIGLVIFAIVKLARRGRAPVVPRPPGAWFPDPSGHHRWRWWDGTSWTAMVSDGDAPGAETA